MAFPASNLTAEHAHCTVIYCTVLSKILKCRWNQFHSKFLISNQSDLAALLSSSVSGFCHLTHFAVSFDMGLGFPLAKCTLISTSGIWLTKLHRLCYHFVMIFSNLCQHSGSLPVPGALDSYY